MRVHGACVREGRLVARVVRIPVPLMYRRAAAAAERLGLAGPAQLCAHVTCVVPGVCTLAIVRFVKDL